MVDYCSDARELIQNVYQSDIDTQSVESYFISAHNTAKKIVLTALSRNIASGRVV